MTNKEDKAQNKILIKGLQEPNITSKGNGKKSFTDSGSYSHEKNNQS